MLIKRSAGLIKRSAGSIKRSAGILALALAGSLSGCAERQQGPQSYMGGKDHMGEALRQTFAAQIVDPTPAYQTVVPETSAAHAAKAVERYNSDKIKMPDRLSAASGGSGGGGSGGGGASSGSSSN